MIDKKILDRYGGRDGGGGANENETREECPVDDFGTFGFLRGSRERATMLELRKKDGGILAVSYGYIDKAEFDPTDGITLHLAGQKIHIKGRNLNREVHPKVRLFEAVCRHRVPWLREADEPANLMAGEKDTVVESIEW
jgi:hypothetical protein